MFTRKTELKSDFSQISFVRASSDLLLPSPPCVSNEHFCCCSSFFGRKKTARKVSLGVSVGENKSIDGKVSEKFFKRQGHFGGDLRKFFSAFVWGDEGERGVKVGEVEKSISG
jgi:hypothetical protein